MTIVLESKIKQIATERGLTAYDLAYMAKTSPQTLYGFWTGNIYTKRIGTLVQIANALGMEPNELFTIKALEPARELA